MIRPSTTACISLVRVGFIPPLGSSCWLLAVHDWLLEAFCARQSCAKPNSTVTEKSTDDFSNRRNIINPDFLPAPIAIYLYYNALGPAQNPFPSLAGTIRFFVTTNMAVEG